MLSADPSYAFHHIQQQSFDYKILVTHSSEKQKWNISHLIICDGLLCLHAALPFSVCVSDYFVSCFDLVYMGPSPGSQETNCHSFDNTSFCGCSSIRNLSLDDVIIHSKTQTVLMFLSIIDVLIYIKKVLFSKSCLINTES